MEMINKEELKQLVASTHGKFFSCKFVKKDNTVRKMTCRTGVTKHLKGVGAKYHKDNLRVVFCSAALDYRNINYDTIFEFKFRGKKYEVK